MKPIVIEAADLFCGAGVASLGLSQACRRLGYRLNLVAVNHWPVAVETHRANHPEAVHLCEDLNSVNPRKVVPSGRLDVLLAGPECTHHSTARGGKPCNDQSRASAWCVLRWATALQIDRILIENVKEFTGWGPLGCDGRPLASRKGETFNAFLDALRSLGYRVEWRILNAADYGDPTTRQRLFIQAARGRRPIVWPEPSHARGGEEGLFGRRRPWRSAREIIDWSIPGESIFARKKPLAPTTLARIEAGIRRFCGSLAEPFLVLLNGGGCRGEGGARALDLPLPTVTAGGEHLGLVQPFLVPTNYGERPGQPPRCHSIDAPMPTVVGSRTHALVEPFIITAAHQGGAERRCHSIHDPIGTITAGGNQFALVSPFLVRYNNNRAEVAARSLAEPLPVADCNDRYGLCLPAVKGLLLDIRFRMLQPHELAKAMSIPRNYVILGTREQRVKQIGNAWPGKLSYKLSRVLLPRRVCA